MRRILLVEDNEMNRDMLSRRLTRGGFEVQIAEDGLQGYEMAMRRKDIDIILLDLSLPGIDGWEVARRVKAAAATSRIPIVTLTAHSMAGDREKAIAAECDDYDTKPVDLLRLIDKIDKLTRAEDAPHD